MINIPNLVRDVSLIRKQVPLIHNVTNYVVMNNTANALLAIGASPIMAHAMNELEDIVNISSALVINIGTLDDKLIDSILFAGKEANKRGIPIVFDPVGAGASKYRTDTSRLIISECNPSIIRGNASEIMALSDTSIKTRGVDSASSVDLDRVKALAMQAHAVLAISGEVDYITNGEIVETVKNGHPMMERVTGMGCTATAILGAFIAVNLNPFEAAFHGMTLMAIAGEVAVSKSIGNGSFQMNFLDELYTIGEDVIRKNIR